MKIGGRALDHQTLEHLRLTAVRRVIEDGDAPAYFGVIRTPISKSIRTVISAAIRTGVSV